MDDISRINLMSTDLDKYVHETFLQLSSRPEAEQHTLVVPDICHIIKAGNAAVDFRHIQKRLRGIKPYGAIVERHLKKEFENRRKTTGLGQIGCGDRQLREGNHATIMSSDNNDGMSGNGLITHPTGLMGNATAPSDDAISSKSGGLPTGSNGFQNGSNGVSSGISCPNGGPSGGAATAIGMTYTGMRSAAMDFGLNAAMMTTTVTNLHGQEMKTTAKTITPSAFRNEGVVKDELMMQAPTAAATATPKGATLNTTGNIVNPLMFGHVAGTQPLNPHGLSRRIAGTPLPAANVIGNPNHQNLVMQKSPGAPDRRNRPGHELSSPPDTNRQNLNACGNPNRPGNPNFNGNLNFPNATNSPGQSQRTLSPSSNNAEVDAQGNRTRVNPNGNTAGLPPNGLGNAANIWNITREQAAARMATEKSQMQQLQRQQQQRRMEAANQAQQMQQGDPNQGQPRNQQQHPSQGHPNQGHLTQQQQRAGPRMQQGRQEHRTATGERHRFENRDRPLVGGGASANAPHHHSNTGANGNAQQPHNGVRRQERRAPAPQAGEVRARRDDADMNGGVELDMSGGGACYGARENQSGGGRVKRTGDVGGSRRGHAGGRQGHFSRGRAERPQDGERSAMFFAEGAHANAPNSKNSIQQQDQSDLEGGHQNMGAEHNADMEATPIQTTNYFEGEHNMQPPDSSDYTEEEYTEEEVTDEDHTGDSVADSVMREAYMQGSEGRRHPSVINDTSDNQFGPQDVGVQNQVRDGVFENASAQQREEFQEFTEEVESLSRTQQTDDSAMNLNQNDDLNSQNAQPYPGTSIVQDSSVTEDETSAVQEETSVVQEDTSVAQEESLPSLQEGVHADEASEDVENDHDPFAQAAEEVQLRVSQAQKPPTAAEVTRMSGIEEEEDLRTSLPKRTSEPAPEGGSAATAASAAEALLPAALVVSAVPGVSAVSAQPEVVQWSLNESVHESPVSPISSDESASAVIPVKAFTNGDSGKDNDANGLKGSKNTEGYDSTADVRNEFVRDKMYTDSKHHMAPSETPLSDGEGTGSIMRNNNNGSQVATANVKHGGSHEESYSTYGTVYGGDHSTTGKRWLASVGFDALGHGNFELEGETGAGVNHLVAVLLEAILVVGTFEVKDDYLNLIIASTESLYASFQMDDRSAEVPKRPEIATALAKKILVEVIDELTLDIEIEIEHDGEGALNLAPIIRRVNTDVHDYTDKPDRPNVVGGNRMSRLMKRGGQKEGLGESMVELAHTKHGTLHEDLKGPMYNKAGSMMRTAAGESETRLSPNPIKDAMKSAAKLLETEEVDDPLDPYQGIMHKTRLSYMKENRPQIFRFLKRLMRALLFSFHLEHPIEKHLHDINTFCRDLEHETLELIGTNDDEIQHLAFGPSNIRWTLDDFITQYWIRTRWPHFDLRARMASKRQGLYGATSLAGEKAKTIGNQVSYEMFCSKTYTLSLHAFDFLHAPDDYGHSHAQHAKTLTHTEDVMELKQQYKTVHSRKEDILDKAGLQTEEPRSARQVVWNVENTVRFIISRCGHDWTRCFAYVKEFARTVGEFFRLHRTRVVRQKVIGSLEQLTSKINPVRAEMGTNTLGLKENYRTAQNYDQYILDEFARENHFEVQVHQKILFNPAYANDCKHFLSRLLYAVMDQFKITKKSNAGHFYLTQVLTEFHSFAEMLWIDFDKHTDFFISVCEYAFVRHIPIEKVDVQHDSNLVVTYAKQLQQYLPKCSIESWDAEADVTKVMHHHSNMKTIKWPTQKMLMPKNRLRLPVKEIDGGAGDWKVKKPWETEPVVTADRAEYLDAQQLQQDGIEDNTCFSTSRYSDKQQVFVYLLLLCQDMEVQRRSCVLPVRVYTVAVMKKVIQSVLLRYNDCDIRNRILNAVCTQIFQISDNATLSSTILVYATQLLNTFQDKFMREDVPDIVEFRSAVQDVMNRIGSITKNDPINYLSFCLVFMSSLLHGVQTQANEEWKLVLYHLVYQCLIMFGENPAILDVGKEEHKHFLIANTLSTATKEQLARAVIKDTWYQIMHVRFYRIPHNSRSMRHTVFLRAWKFAQNLRHRELKWSGEKSFAKDIVPRKGLAEQNFRTFEEFEAKGAVGHIKNEIVSEEVGAKMKADESLEKKATAAQEYFKATGISVKPEMIDLATGKPIDHEEEELLLNRRTLIQNILELGRYDLEHTMDIFAHFCMDVEHVMTGYDLSPFPQIPLDRLMKIKRELHIVLLDIISFLKVFHAEEGPSLHATRAEILFGMNPDFYGNDVKDFLGVILRMKSPEEAAMALCERAKKIAPDHISCTKVIQEFLFFLLQSMHLERTDLEATFLWETMEHTFAELGAKTEIQKRVEFCTRTLLKRKLNWKTRLVAKHVSDPQRKMAIEIINEASKEPDTPLNFELAGIDAYTIMALTQQCPNTIEAHILKLADLLKYMLDQLYDEARSLRSRVWERTLSYLQEVCERIEYSYNRVHAPDNQQIFVCMHKETGFPVEKIMKLCRHIMLPETTVTEEFFHELAEETYIKFHDYNKAQSPDNEALSEMERADTILVERMVGKHLHELDLPNIVEYNLKARLIPLLLVKLLEARQKQKAGLDVVFDELIAGDENRELMRAIESLMRENNSAANITTEQIRDAIIMGRAADEQRVERFRNLREQAMADPPININLLGQQEAGGGGAGMDQMANANEYGKLQMQTEGAHNLSHQSSLPGTMNSLPIINGTMTNTMNNTLQGTGMNAVSDSGEMHTVPRAVSGTLNSVANSGTRNAFAGTMTVPVNMKNSKAASIFVPKTIPMGTPAMAMTGTASGSTGGMPPMQQHQMNTQILNKMSSDMNQMQHVVSQYTQNLTDQQIKNVANAPQYTEGMHNFSDSGLDQALSAQLSNLEDLIQTKHEIQKMIDREMPIQSAQEPIPLGLGMPPIQAPTLAPIKFNLGGAATLQAPQSQQQIPIQMSQQQMPEQELHLAAPQQVRQQLSPQVVHPGSVMLNQQQPQSASIVAPPIQGQPPVQGQSQMPQGQPTVAVDPTQFHAARAQTIMPQTNYKSNKHVVDMADGSEAKAIKLLPQHDHALPLLSEHTNDGNHIHTAVRGNQKEIEVHAWNTLNPYANSTKVRIDLEKDLHRGGNPYGNGQPANANANPAGAAGTNPTGNPVGAASGSIPLEKAQGKRSFLKATTGATGSQQGLTDPKLVPEATLDMQEKYFSLDGDLDPERKAKLKQVYDFLQTNPEDLLDSPIAGDNDDDKADVKIGSSLSLKTTRENATTLIQDGRPAYQHRADKLLADYHQKEKGEMYEPKKGPFLFSYDYGDGPESNQSSPYDSTIHVHDTRTGLRTVNYVDNNNNIIHKTMTCDGNQNLRDFQQNQGYGHVSPQQMAHVLQQQAMQQQAMMQQGVKGMPTQFMNQHKGAIPQQMQSPQYMGQQQMQSPQCLQPPGQGPEATRTEHPLVQNVHTGDMLSGPIYDYFEGQQKVHNKNQRMDDITNREKIDKINEKLAQLRSERGPIESGPTYLSRDEALIDKLDDHHKIFINEVLFPEEDIDAGGNLPQGFWKVHNSTRYSFNDVKAVDRAESLMLNPQSLALLLIQAKELAVTGNRERTFTETIVERLRLMKGILYEYEKRDQITIRNMQAFSDIMGALKLDLADVAAHPQRRELRSMVGSLHMKLRHALQASAIQTAMLEARQLKEAEEKRSEQRKRERILTYELKAREAQMQYLQTEGASRKLLKIHNIPHVDCMDVDVDYLQEKLVTVADILSSFGKVAQHAAVNGLKT